MRITKVKVKINDDPQTSFLKGINSNNESILYDADTKNKTKKVEIKQIVEKRIEAANTTTERLYSIFRNNMLPNINKLIMGIVKSDKSDIVSMVKNYEIYIDNGDISNIDKYLKEEYKDFSQIIKQLCNLKTEVKDCLTQEEIEKIKELVNKVKENIKKITERREIDSIVKSIENQKIKYKVENNDIVLNDECLKNLFNIIKENKLKELFSSIDKCLFKIDTQSEKEKPVFLELDKDTEFCKEVSEEQYKTKEYNKNNFDIFMETLNEGIKKYKNDSKEEYEKYKWIIEKIRDFIIKDLKTDFFKSEINYNTYKERLNNEKIKRKVFGKINNYINSKIIEYGKIIHYFKGEKNITSFDLETVTAYEELIKTINSSLLFSLAIAQNIDAIKTKPKEVLKYFGGISSICISKYNGCVLKNKDCDCIISKYNGCVLKNKDCDCIISKYNKLKDKNKKQDNIFVEMLNKIRNSTFHFGVENPKDQKDKNILEFLIGLYHQNCSQIQQYIKKKYESNNVCAFYNNEDIKNLLEQLYSKSSKILTSQVFIPSFKNIFSSIKKEEDFQNLINKNLNQNFNFDQTIHFVLQEIYYQAFLQENDFRKMCFDDVICKEHKKYNIKNKSNLTKEEQNYVRPFESFYSLYNENKNCQFDTFAKKLQVEVAREDSKLPQSEQGNCSHYTLIFRQMLAKSLITYIQKNFNFIFYPKQQSNNNLKNEDISFNNYIKVYSALIPQETELDKSRTEIYSKTSFLLSYYVLAKFIPTTQINLLKGTFQHYKEYIEDIKLRADFNSVSTASTEFINKYMVDKHSEKQILKYFDDILAILNLCQETSSIVSNNWEDYYDSEDDYAKFLSPFFECKFENLEVLKKWDTTNKYQDGENPILFSQIEKSRMFGLIDIIKEVYSNNKIKKEDIKTIKNIENSQKYKSFHKLTDAKSFPNKTEWEKVFDKKTQYMHLINKVQFTDIAKLSSLMIDLYSPMLDWLYMWERDCRFFLLGIIKIKDIKKINNKDSFEYIEEVFTYNKSEDGGVTVVSQIENFIKNIPNKIHNDKTLQKFILKQLFKIKKIEDFHCIKELRNSIEHYDYFKKRDANYYKNIKQECLQNYSILDFYTNIAKKILCYNKKIQNNVVPKIVNILEKHKIIWEGKKLSHDKGKYYNDFLSQDFVKAVSNLLNYPNKTNECKEKKKKPFKLNEGRKIILDSKLISDKCEYICPIKHQNDMKK